jgi:hypothetical protein
VQANNIAEKIITNNIYRGGKIFKVIQETIRGATRNAKP